MMDIKRYFSLKLLSNFRSIFFKIKNTKKNVFLFFPSVIACIIIVFILPLFFLLYSTNKKREHLIQAEKRIESLEIKAKQTELIRSRAGLFIKQLQTADKEFLKHQIESLTFLQKEKKALEFFFKTPVIKESFSLLERQKQLEKNKIAFEEISINEKEKIQEKIYTLKAPMEIDFIDLQKLLDTIESPSSIFSCERPQLIFQKFTLKRKKLSQSYELLECDFKLIERNLMEKL